MTHCVRRARRKLEEAATHRRARWTFHSGQRRVHAHEPRSYTRHSGEARDRLWRSGSRPPISSTHGPLPLWPSSTTATRLTLTALRGGHIPPRAGSSAPPPALERGDAVDTTPHCACAAHRTLTLPTSNTIVPLSCAAASRAPLPRSAASAAATAAATRDATRERAATRRASAKSRSSGAARCGI